MQVMILIENAAGHTLSLDLSDIHSVLYPAQNPTRTNELFIMEGGQTHEAPPGTFQGAIDALILSNPHVMLDLAIDGITGGIAETEHFEETDADVLAANVTLFISQNQPLAVMQSEWFHTGTGGNEMFHCFLTYHQ